LFYFLKLGLPNKPDDNVAFVGYPLKDIKESFKDSGSAREDKLKDGKSIIAPILGRNSNSKYAMSF